MPDPHPLAYLEAYAVARSCLAALADLDGVGSWHHELLLIELDGLHLVFPAHGSLAGNRELLLLILEMALDRMIDLGGEVIGLELVLVRALCGPC